MPPLILTQYFYPEPNGSAPPITDLARWLAEQGESPEVITARPSYPDRRVFEGYRKGERDKEVWEGVSVRRLASLVTRNSSVLGRLLTEGSFCLSLAWHKLFRHKSNAVISVCPSIFVALIAPNFVAPHGRHIVIVHDIQSGLGSSTGASKAVTRVLELLERIALNRVDAIVTLSPGMADALRNIGINKPIEIAPPQIDVKSFDFAPDPNVGLVVYSGAMGRKQGLHQILDAAEILQSRGSQIRLILRGQGGLKDELVADAEKKNLRNVTFEPLVPAAGLNEAMALGSIHIVPQDAEGANFAVPSKVFSIMASGRPFLATAYAGSPLALLSEESGAGICVPPNAPEELADALERAIADPTTRRRLGMNGRRYVERQADRSVVCEKIWSLLSQPCSDFGESDPAQPHR